MLRLILANDAGRLVWIGSFENLLLVHEYKLVRIAFLIDTVEKKAEMMRHTTKRLETWLVTLRAWIYTITSYRFWKRA